MLDLVVAIEGLLYLTILVNLLIVGVLCLIGETKK
jgi:hypothetical protein